MTADEVCAALGVSRSSLSTYIKDGLPRDTSRRPHRYDLDECRAWIKANVAPRGGDRYGIEGDDELSDGSAQELYRRERALKTAAERELRELKLAEERGELVRAADVNAEWQRAALAIRGRLLQIAASLAAPLSEAASEQECEDLVAKAIRTALEELADVE